MTGIRLALVLAATSVCEIVEPPPGPADLDTFPYHPLVFELDLLACTRCSGRPIVKPERAV